MTETVMFSFALAGVFLGLVYWAWRMGLKIGMENGQRAGLHTGTENGLKLAGESVRKAREGYVAWWQGRSSRERDCGDPEHVFRNRLAGLEMAHDVLRNVNSVVLDDIEAEC